MEFYYRIVEVSFVQVVSELYAKRSIYFNNIFCNYYICCVCLREMSSFLIENLVYFSGLFQFICNIIFASIFLQLLHTNDLIFDLVNKNIQSIWL